jgi:hypothetical protein
VDRVLRRRGIKLLTALPASSLIFGFLEYGPARGPAGGSTLLTLHVLLTIAIVCVWFWIDVRSRGYRASIVLKLAMPAITVVALPYYLFRSRGLFGGVKALAWSTVVLAGTMIAYHLGSWFA